MNRIIKFRAWSEKNQTMHYSGFVIWADEGFGEFPQGGWDVGGYDEGLKLMQFIGQTDKNGVEIFEGDLIHRHLHVNWAVKFKNSKWIGDAIKSGSGLYLDASQFKECEVIGNIYDK